MKSPSPRSGARGGRIGLGASFPGSAWERTAHEALPRYALGMLGARQR